METMGVSGVTSQLYQVDERVGDDLGGRAYKHHRRASHGS
jgi:hypothetical protein